MILTKTSPVSEADKKIMELCGQYMEIFLDEYLKAMNYLNTYGIYPTEKLETILIELRGEKLRLSRNFLNTVKSILEKEEK